MPSKTLEIARSGFRRRLDIIKSTLTLLKGKLSKPEYIHVKRLITDGTERDLIFTQGLATGMELAALNKKDTIAIINIIKSALDKAATEETPLKKADLEKIEAVLKNKFPFGARRRMLSMLSRADSIFLNGLVEMLYKVA